MNVAGRGRSMSGAASGIFDDMDVHRRNRRGQFSLQPSRQPGHGLDRCAHLELRVLVDDRVDQALTQKLAAIGRQFVRDEDDVLAREGL